MQVLFILLEMVPYYRFSFNTTLSIRQKGQPIWAERYLKLNLNWSCGQMRARPLDSPMCGKGMGFEGQEISQPDEKAASGQRRYGLLVNIILSLSCLKKMQNYENKKSIYTPRGNIFGKNFKRTCRSELNNLVKSVDKTLIKVMKYI